ncbi:MAG: hypothetical protein LBE92_19175 [Chryseobacterium sp.]|jgi:hypothetical protein|uniref:hypothetical protein n=1 Tax=Chryseobacterium sp. TaxID=1871047 RepID=UPI00282E416D|nr:hypothetical protein [Chryseobacterium sp.]MDR2238253.1 hypothetical protein [Chryseobacterium sp.]
MEKIYLPQDFTGVFPKEEYSYFKIQNNSFAVGFTINKSIEMNIGERYKDQLNANLTAVTWIEDNRGDYQNENFDLPSFDRIIKVCTIYLDRGGFIVEGFYRAIKYYGEVLSPPENKPSDARIEKKIKDEYNTTLNFKSKGMELHEEIFVKGIIRIEGFEDVKINSKSVYFKLLREASIFNRCCDMNFVYAVANEEQETFEKIKTIIGLAAIPFTIEAGAFVKSLQMAVGLVSYLCDIDSTFSLSEKLYEYKGPVVISDVYSYSYRNNPFTNEKGDIDWGTPNKDPAYDSGAVGIKTDTLEKFKKLQTILKIN